MTDVAILGFDGYTGWPLTCRLLDHGYDVVGVDHLRARDYRGQSVTPIAVPPVRYETANDHFDGRLHFANADITDYYELLKVLHIHSPTTVVNLAQIPSAPYSMRSLDHAWQTQVNNIRGALNLYWAIDELGLDTHVVQLATMGEYGTPDAPLPEGFLDDGRPAPKQPGSLYHASKVATTVNTLFLSRLWDIPTTEIYQGIVYGVTTDATDRDERLMTRFDADEAFGTVINRFTAQAAVDHPLTVYGKGGQRRAMLSLQDCVRCLHLAIEHPPGPGVPGRHPYRAINQFDGAYRVNEVAEMVRELTGATITHVDNPRAEDDSEHFYEPQREVLDALGYEPARPVREEIRRTYDRIEKYRDRIDVDALRPRTHWVTPD